MSTIDQLLRDQPTNAKHTAADAQPKAADSQVPDDPCCTPPPPDPGPDQNI